MHITRTQTLPVVFFNQRAAYPQLPQRTLPVRNTGQDGKDEITLYGVRYCCRAPLVALMIKTCTTRKHDNEPVDDDESAISFIETGY